MRMPLSSRIIFYILTVYMAVGAHVFDWQTHIHSPRWPSHAREVPRSSHDGELHRPLRVDLRHRRPKDHRQRPNAPRNRRLCHGLLDLAVLRNPLPWHSLRRP